MADNLKLGSGSFTYEVTPEWENLPDGYSWTDAAGVAVDSQDRVYIFNRGEHPIIILDSDGKFLSSWGEDIFTKAHGITIGPDDMLYCTDEGDHTVRKCTPEGEILLTIGTPGRPSKPYGGDPFNRCTDVAIDPMNGDLYVSDGYVNARVHKYSPNGDLLFSWGTPGTAPGEFNLVHNIATDKDGFLYVADRENHRIQVFDRMGKFQTQWNNMHRPCAIYISDEQVVYVGELGAGMPVNQATPNIGPRIAVMNSKGELLERIGSSGYGFDIGQFAAPHSICLDSNKDMYIGEVAWTNCKNMGYPADGVRSFQKLTLAN